MKAWAFKKYKGEILALDVPDPIVGDTDVLIQVKAVGLNHVDELLRAGAFKALLPLPLPAVIGKEAAGVVLAVGKAVSGIAVGDEVIAKPNILAPGTLTERISVPVSEVALKPKTLSMVEAGSLSLVSLTAWQALVSLGNVQPGQSVLIHGGSGGVGSIAVQLAKHLGAYVATTSSAANADYVRSLGADLVIDYKSEDFTNLVSGYDLVLDQLGGKNLIKSLSVLKPGGIAIGIAGPPDPDFAREANRGPIVEFIVGRLSAKVRKVAKKHGVRYKFLLIESSGSQLAEIGKLVDSGKILTKVAQTFSFDAVPDALAALEKGNKKAGKIVIEF
jgi:NADPH:quinone reductase-like Zn-dependent oxidoreductase